jgi:pilus assembly protein CpaC
MATHKGRYNVMMRSSFIHPSLVHRSFVQRAALLAALIIVPAGLARAQSGAEALNLKVGQSVVIDYPSDIRQVDFSNPEILDGNAVTTREIVLHGKGLGSTTMIVWSKTGQRTFYNITVDTNVDPLKRLLKESFPNENIQVSTSRDSISLNGHVSSKEVQDRAVALATPFARTIVPNMQFGSPAGIERQILLRVKFLDLDRSKELQYGVNLLGLGGQTLAGTSNGQFSASALTGSLGAGSGQASTVTSTISKALNIFALDPKLNIGALIQALEAETIAQTLAEPTLIATNGKEAFFLVGGEVPVPVLQGGANAGAVTIQYKEFGIKLIFTPNITENRTIKLHLRQEVSSLDFSNAVILSGFTIPALQTRRAETDVEMGEGQSFVIAGLVNNTEVDTFNKVPVLGSIPIFGALFKSRQETKTREDLVVVVTPEITMPINASDPQPNIYMPKDFLVRLSPGDLPQAQPKKK